MICYLQQQDVILAQHRLVLAKEGARFARELFLCLLPLIHRHQGLVKDVVAQQALARVLSVAERRLVARVHGFVLVFF